MFVRYCQVQGCTPEHIIAIKAEVSFRKERHTLNGAPVSRGYVMRVQPVERKRTVIPASGDRPETVMWSEVIHLCAPGVTVVLKEAARKGPKMEVEADLKAEAIYTDYVRQVAKTAGWQLTGKEGLPC